MQMLDDRVAIRPLSDPDKIGSIWVPDTAKKRQDQGIIIYRGPNTKDLKVGDHVLYPAYSGTKIVVADEGTYTIMPEDEVVALLGEGHRVYTQNEIEATLDEAFNNLYAIRHDLSNRDDIRDYINSVMDLLSSAPIRAMEN